MKSCHHNVTRSWQRDKLTGDLINSPLKLLIRSYHSQTQIAVSNGARTLHPQPSFNRLPLVRISLCVLHGILHETFGQRTKEFFRQRRCSPSRKFLVSHILVFVRFGGISRGCGCCPSSSWLRLFGFSVVFFSSGIVPRTIACASSSSGRLLFVPRLSPSSRLSSVTARLAVATISGFLGFPALVLSIVWLVFLLLPLPAILGTAIGTFLSILSSIRFGLHGMRIALVSIIWLWSYPPPAIFSFIMLRLVAMVATMP